jgi:hypothetical protein
MGTLMANARKKPKKTMAPRRGSTIFESSRISKVCGVELKYKTS